MVPNDHLVIHEKCSGCQRIEKCNFPSVEEFGTAEIVVDTEKKFCKAYRNPAMWWDRLGSCPLATHIKKKAEQEHKRVGQQKQKKKKR